MNSFEKFGSWLLAQYKELVAAIGFLTTIPIPGSAQLFRTDEPEPKLVIGSLYFPLVGLLVGALLACIVVIASHFVPALVLAALLIVGQILLTGGLHLDGLMDSCDGLFGGRSREHKLEIMRDSRVGSFGVLGGVGMLLLKFSVFASLSPSSLVLAFFTILPISRWAMVLAIYLFPSARPTGLGAATRQTVTRRRLITATLLVLLLTVLSGRLAGLMLLIFGALGTLALGRWITSNLGGLTGDSYGAIAESSEALLFVLFLLLRPWL